jgi:hypothetical protein
MALIPEQLQHYRDQGYALGNQLLNGDDLIQLQRQINTLIDALPVDQRPENMPSMHYQNPYLRDLFLSDPLPEHRRCGITIKYIPTYVKIDRTFVSPSGFDWSGLRLFLARGKKGEHEYAN